MFPHTGYGNNSMDSKGSILKYSEDVEHHFLIFTLFPVPDHFYNCGSSYIPFRLCTVYQALFV